VVATAFIDFRKAFDCVSHRTQLHKLKIKFGIEGNLLSWLTDYLHHRTQVTIVNCTQSEELNVTCGIPQGSVLRPCLFSLYTNDMPEAVTSGNLYLHADDTTVYCIGSTVDEVCNLLNNALNELNKWCMTNSLTPHSSKCEVMLFHRRGNLYRSTPFDDHRNCQRCMGLSHKAAGHYYRQKTYLGESP